jgi:hypothetical protein
MQIRELAGDIPSAEKRSWHSGPETYDHAKWEVASKHPITPESGVKRGFYLLEHRGGLLAPRKLLFPVLRKIPGSEACN